MNKEWSFWEIFVLILLLVLVSILIYNTNWDNICTSWLRFSKAYMGTCMLKGYPLFP
jgi:hypothetical protein